MPGCLLFIPLASHSLNGANHFLLRFTFFSSVFLIWMVLAFIVVHSQSGFITKNQKPQVPWDNTLELFDWSQIETDLSNLIENTQTKHKKVLGALNWFEAGQVNTALKNRYPTLVLRGNPHHFQYLTQIKESTSLFLIKIKRLNSSTQYISDLKNLYPAAAVINKLILKRGDTDYAELTIILIENYKPHS